MQQMRRLRDRIYAATLFAHLPYGERKRDNVIISYIFLFTYLRL